MQEWRPMTTHHFLLRHAEAIATSTLPLSFSGLVLEGAANFWWAHKALATWATLIAMPSMLLMFHLSWQELLTFWNVFFGELRR